MTTQKAKFRGLALIAALCAGFTLGLTAPAWANADNKIPRTGEELGQVCAAVSALIMKDEPTVEEVVNSQVCLVYIQASLDGFELMVYSLRRKQLVCFPEGTQALDRAHAVVRWLANHPEKKNLHAATVVVGALSDAFPCK